MNEMSKGTLYITDKNGNCHEMTSDSTEITLDRSSLTSDVLKYDYSANVSIDCEPSNIWDTVIGKFNASDIKSIEMQVVTGWKIVQNRKHRKKRINKKWLGKYGFRYEPIYETKNAEVLEIKASDFNSTDKMVEMNVRF